MNRNTGEETKVNWIIRPATPDDAQGVINILNPIIEEAKYTILDIPFSLEEEVAFIESFPVNGIFNLAIHPETQQVVGFQVIEPFATYTHAFDHVGVIGSFVDSGFMRKGIASSLFLASFEIAKTMGYEKLFAYVRQDNERALATYLKQGFEQIGLAKKHAKIRGEYIDEVLIEKFLNANTK
ncbi:GNAT family N-acetyltransferase [Marinomonas sp. PE14-40]|uniref:GNAT family N-acetyltransferase n=1 Tax=Marinomonas sp. PE14-40 TaxID=3060621 RepID=UPI003F663D42